ncbi:MAG: hypothetical protein LBK42_13480 [Propionibacteriaceae bacterium]|jgi:hypothetical protein|nr:hypothetical protein [Propionibacteriaceae bacterium]
MRKVKWATTKLLAMASGFVMALGLIIAVTPAQEAEAMNCSSLYVYGQGTKTGTAVKGCAWNTSLATLAFRFAWPASTGCASFGRNQTSLSYTSGWPWASFQRVDPVLCCACGGF